MVMTRSRRARSESKEDITTESQSVDETEKEELQNRVNDQKGKADDTSEKDSNEKTESDQDDDDSSSDDDDDDDNEESDSEQQQHKVKIQDDDGMEKEVFVKRARRRKKQKNELTKLIPGYTAPMGLNTSSLDRYRPTGGIADLQKRAERTDASTKGFVVEASKRHTDSMQKGSNGLLPTSYAAAYSSFKKGKTQAPDNSAGKGWFGMTPTPMTDELKTDLAVIRNRTYLDPKKFYKSADKHHKIVQVGTVIEGAAEYYSARLTKSERRTNFTEEIMADPESADWAKNKFKQMSRDQNNQSKKRKHKKAKKGKKIF